MTRDHVSSATLVGRLGQKPELEETPEGVKFARLNIATSERFTDRAGKIRETTEWTRAVAWGEQATRIAAEFDKGDAVCLMGSLRVSSYEKDGAKNRVLELHVDSATPSSDPGLSRNEAQLLGVVRNIEQKAVQNGALTVVSLATTTLQNGKSREDWHSVTLWGKTAAAAVREIRVGDTLAVNGSIQHRNVEDPEGVERRLSAVQGDRFQVLGRTQGRKQEIPAATDAAAGEGDTPAAPPRSRGHQRGKSVEPGM